MICRFINCDGYVSTGNGILGHNMSAYCGNNPVNRVNPTGNFWLTVLIITAITVVCAIGLSGCSSSNVSGYQTSQLADKPNLDVNTASPGSYNCYGNAIKKQVVSNPTGYKPGDSTRKTFEAVKKDLGANNIRELKSINDAIKKYEYKVALKCGPNDYHFIRQEGTRWYNKSGTAPGLYIGQEVVAQNVWCAMWEVDGTIYKGDPNQGFPYYDDETIYFAVREDWSKR